MLAVRENTINYLKAENSKFQRNVFIPQEAEPLKKKRSIKEIEAKSIINKVTSPDLGFEYSVNPYQGCEHACSYCYARPTHQYWDCNSGSDFEYKLFVKTNAPQLLKEALLKFKESSSPIVFSGNTDCYQPIERKYNITREMLKVMLELKHPVGIITKNSLILKDLDLLKELAQHKLLKVNISFTTLDETLRRKMEPKTATIHQRLKTLETLTANNIWVGGNIAPIIPALNDHEMTPLVKAIAEHGAKNVHYQVLRLNATTENVFEEWIQKNYPNKSNKIMNLTRKLHGGNVHDFKFGRRMKGEGLFAEMLKFKFDYAKNTYLPRYKNYEYDFSAFNHRKTAQKQPQLKLAL